MPRIMIRFWTLFLALLTLAGLLGAAVGGMTVRAAPVAEVGQTDIVISEFRTRGPTGGNDEFVEIFNPTNAAINITGWKINASNNAGTTSTRFTIAASTTLQPGEHYLFTNSNGYSGSVAGDGTYATGITDDGGIALLRADNSIADQVGMSIGSAYKESTLLAPLSANANQSYERKPGGLLGSCYDSNNSDFDFAFKSSSSDPQNHAASPATVCSPPTATPPATTPPPTATSTLTPIAPTHIVISEFRSTGPGGAGDEFVELFNATGAATNIGGWVVKKSSGCGTTVSTLFTIPANVILFPGQHYLAAATGSTVTGADQTISAGISDDGGIALFTSASSTVPLDAVGMCTTTAFREGTPLLPLSGTANQSYERAPGGTAGGCYDLDSNAADFKLISPASPMNRASPIGMCSGVVLASPTVTALPTNTATPTRTTTPTRVPTAIPGIILINEILPHPRADWNKDGVINYGDEYIELINAGTDSYTLKGWVLANAKLRSAYTIPTTTLLPQQILILFHSQTGISLSDGGDQVILYRTTGAINDAFTYPIVDAADRTWCRLPDGRGAWSFGCWPSPGKPNSRTGAGMPTPAAVSVCPLADVVPPVVQFAECGSPGDSIWRSDFWNEGEFWPKSRGKDVIVK